MRLRVTQKALQSSFQFFYSFSFSSLLLDEMEKVIFKLFPNAALSTCDQDRSCYYMSCTFKPCPVEINSDDGLKWEHLEFSSSVTKSMSLLSQDLWSPNLTGGWLTMSGSHPKVKWLWLRGLSKSRDKLKSFYLYCQSAYYYQTW